MLTHTKKRKIAPLPRCPDYCFRSPRFRFRSLLLLLLMLFSSHFVFFFRCSSLFCPRTKKIKCRPRRRVSFHPPREAEEAPTSSSARRAARRAREASRRARTVLLPLPLRLLLLRLLRKININKISFAWEKGSRYSPPFLRRSFSPPRAGGRFFWRVIWCFHRPRTRKRTTRVCPSLRARTLRRRLPQKGKS